MRAIFVMSAALALAGCADNPEIARLLEPFQAAPVLAPPPPPPANEPTPTERAAAALGRNPVGDVSVAALPPARVGPDPARLTGMVPAQLTDLLGQPNLRRKEKEAEVWMYSSRLCVLHLFLYPGANGGVLGVKHMEVRRPNSATPVPPRDCLDSVIARKPRTS
jgi:hypothetical protein